MAGKKKPGNSRSRGAGRREKTSAVAHARVTDLFSQYEISERERKELLSILSDLFCRGCTQAEIKKQILEHFSDSYAKLLQGENFWDLLREAASETLFTHMPREDIKLTRYLLGEYAWLDDHLVVAESASTGALAQQAAKTLLAMIRTVCRQKQCNTVHVGFAGGMTLRVVAEKLAQLLRQPHEDAPETLVFHAMVASFDDDDFYADPNSFISYFITPGRPSNVRLVRLPLPGIIESARYREIRELSAIERVFARRHEIQIIVTSGSLWNDQRSTLRTYMKAMASESQRTSGSGSSNAVNSDEVIQQFDELGVVGDLLWQPVNKEGPVRIQSDYQVTTLMDLDELPEFINNGGSVLLVMGCSGVSGEPKSELLRTILDLHPRYKWVTDVVTDTPTAERMYAPGARSNLPSRTRRRTPK